MSEPEKPKADEVVQPQNFSSKDATDFGKDVIKTSSTWVIAGLLTKFIRSGMDKIWKNKNGS